MLGMFHGHGKDQPPLAFCGQGHDLLTSRCHQMRLIGDCGQLGNDIVSRSHAYPIRGDLGRGRLRGQGRQIVSI